MCGAQTGSHPSAASKGLMQGWVSLTGKQTQTLFNVTARIPDVSRRAVRDPGLAGDLAGSSEECPAGPGQPSLCHASHARLSLSVPLPTGRALGCVRAGWSRAGPFSSGELERCTNGTCDPTGLSVVLCCPKTQHSSPSGAALG